MCETVHVLSNWYFTREYIEERFLDKVIEFLYQKYKCASVNELCRRTTFVVVKNIGQSQKQLVQMLGDRLYDQYGITLKTKIKEDTSHFVYIDDGLYTSSRARKDLPELIYQIFPGSSLDVFYLIAGSNGLAYTQSSIASW